MWQARSWQKRVIPAMVGGNILMVWEPGVGKTYPVLIAAQFMDGPTLIVVPAHLRQQWLEEAKTHAPLLATRIFDKTTVKITDEEFRTTDIFIVSYEFVTTFDRWKQLRLHRWGAIAVDEAHYLTNLEASRTRAMLGLKVDERQGLVFAADVVWLLTGTPFTFPNEIYPILSRVFPGAVRRPEEDGPGFMTAREWENRFCVVKEKEDGFGVKVVDAKNIPELRERLAPYLDKQKLVLDRNVTLSVDTIPIKATLKQITKGLDADVIAQYAALEEVLEDDAIKDDEKLAALEGAGLVMAQVRHVIAVTKVRPTAEIARHELFTGVRKLIIFGWHRAPLEALAKELDAPLIYGAMGGKRKANAKREFIEGDAPILLGQISAIGTGTDGLQHVCNRSLFMESPWTVRENKQCLHRTYRTGQRSPCHTSYISLVGSIDEYVARILKRNAGIVSKALD